MFGRKKGHEGDFCVACDRGLRDGQKVCECGTATRFMTFEERTAYEVELWRRAQARTAVEA